MDIQDFCVPLLQNIQFSLLLNFKRKNVQNRLKFRVLLKLIVNRDKGLTKIGYAQIGAYIARIHRCLAVQATP
jgi:hypothetical protein